MGGDKARRPSTVIRRKPVPQMLESTSLLSEAKPVVPPRNAARRPSLPLPAAVPRRPSVVPEHPREFEECLNFDAPRSSISEDLVPEGIRRASSSSTDSSVSSVYSEQIFDSPVLNGVDATLTPERDARSSSLETLEDTLRTDKVASGKIVRSRCPGYEFRRAKPDIHEPALSSWQKSHLSLKSLTSRKPADLTASGVAPFSTYLRPSADDLQSAANCTVLTETGMSVRFGDLFKDRKTIVCFIRHFYCPSCQDYMASISRITPAQLDALGLKLIVVGCGSWKMISGYRKSLPSKHAHGFPFPIYSDPTRALYHHMGMNKTSMSPGKRGNYIQHSAGINVYYSIKRTMPNVPLFAAPGALGALGGEFVLGPGAKTCSYTHRMKATREHAELADILKAIGVTIPAQLYHQITQPVKTVASAGETWCEADGNGGQCRRVSA